MNFNLNFLYFELYTRFSSRSQITMGDVENQRVDSAANF